MRFHKPYRAAMLSLCFSHTYFRPFAFSIRKVFFFATYEEGAEKVILLLFFFSAYRLLLSSQKQNTLVLVLIIVPITRVSFICLHKRYSIFFLRKFLQFPYDRGMTTSKQVIPFALSAVIVP